jgi:two-component system, cell cycle sensor histidine kinase and response regulator CckA
MNTDTERLKLILSTANEGYWDWNLAADRVYLSPRFLEFTGYSSDAAEFDTAFLKMIIHPDDHHKFFFTTQDSVQDKKEMPIITCRMISKSGTIRWIESRGSIVEHDKDGNIVRMVGTIVGITERKQAEDELHKLNRALLTISNCNQVLLHADNEMELLRDICRIVVEAGGYRMAWVGYAENDEEKSVRPVAQAGFEDGYLETLMISWADVERGRGPTGSAIRTGKPCSIKNMLVDPEFALWRQEAIKRGYTSAQSVPLKADDKVFGALTIYSPFLKAFNAEERKLLTALADNLAYGITMLRNRKARELAEDELRQSEARYRCLFQNKQTVMLIIDPKDGRIVDANPAAETFYGWEQAELCQMKISQINMLTEQEVQSEMELARQEKRNFFTFRHCRADGSVRDVEVFTAPIILAGRSLLYSIINDITERQEFQEALLASNERMHLVMAATNAGIWESEQSTNINIWSDELWRLFGLKPQSCEPSLENWLKTIIPEDRDKVEQAVTEALKSGGEFNSIWRMRDAVGKVRWLMSKGNPVKDSDGKISRYSGIVLDITERKRAEEKKQQLESHLRKSQRLETIGTLAGGIAHDLNNILAPILDYAELGMLELTDKEALHEYFSEISQAVMRAQSLVSQIFLFSRAQESTPTIVSVQAVLAEALKLLCPLIPATITIEQHIDKSCRNILADSSQIHQVIVNLCTNAFQAMEGFGGLLTIELKEINPGTDLPVQYLDLQAESCLQLSISDTGTGMDDATMERIFEPFFTTKSVNKGTGLGLSVVHGIITSFKGKIVVESQKGKGTTFRVYLPVVNDQIMKHTIKEIPGQGHGRILLVDDDPALLRVMTKMITKIGFTVHALNSPLQAVELFRQNPEKFDLLITDLIMPKMTGLELAEELHKTNSQFPIILMTGYGKDIDPQILSNFYGISKFLNKPVKLTEVALAINALLFPQHQQYQAVIGFSGQ